jgi:hypothetical protein
MLDNIFCDFPENPLVFDLSDVFFEFPSVKLDSAVFLLSFLEGEMTSAPLVF